MSRNSIDTLEASATTLSDAKNPFSLSLADFARDLSVNTTSVLVAAQQALQGFERLPDSASRTFIYTGNKLNTATMAPLLSLGVGKSATSHMIQSAATVFADRGYKFYYADERTADGSPVYNDINGEAHAKHYLDLAQAASQGPWQQTFVKDVGYKEFPAN